MNQTSVRLESRLNILSMIGPAFVILSILALVIKESPFYIDLSATALVGLLLCWRLKAVGLCLATALLSLVLAYDFFFDGIPVTLWEVGLGVSLWTSFLVTSLSSKELTDAFHQACKTAASTATLEIETWKEQITDVIAGKEALTHELAELTSKVLPLQDALKDKTEKAEMFERLLEMARNELLQINNENEKLAQRYHEEKNQVCRLDGDIKDLKYVLAAAHEDSKKWGELNVTLEKEIVNQSAMTHAKEEQLSRQAMRVIDLEWELERAHQELALQKSLTSDSDGKVQALGEQMEALIDRLKNLQNEKDELEKALDEALKPAEGVQDTRELKRMSGLYYQLRSQFEDKSATLNETRRLLFQTEEKLLAFEKTAQEMAEFDRDETLASFERYIILLSTKIESLETEIELLT